MFCRLLSVLLGAAIASGLALLTGTLADALDAGSVALLIGVLAAGGMDGVVIGGGHAGPQEADFGEDVCQRDKPAGAL